MSRPRVVRARYEGGVLKPLEPLRLREGEELELVIVEKSFRGFSERAGRYVFSVERDVVAEYPEERR